MDTSSNSVDLLFFTDDSGDSRGWKVHYTTESKEGLSGWLAGQSRKEAAKKRRTVGLM